MVALLGRSWNNPTGINLHDPAQGEIPEVDPSAADTDWRPQKRLSEDEIDELVAARVEGEEIQVLAERFGVGRSTVDRHLRDRGVPKQRWPGRRLDSEQIQQAGELYASGVRLDLVAGQFGVTRVYLRKVFPEAGFPIRRGGQQKRV